VSRLYLRVYLAFVAVVVVFFAASSVLFFWHRGGAREEAWLAAAAKIAALVLAPAEAPAGAQAARVAAVSEALGVGAALFDADGRRLAEAGRFAPLPDLEREGSHLARGTGLLAGGPRRDALLLRLADGRWLSLRLPPAPHEHGGFFVGLALLALLIAAVAYPVARWLARRIEALTARVDAFGAGDLSARAEIAGQDEVARLAASFNQAAARIEALVGTQRTLLASASHALRSPLARLRVAAELLTGERAPAPDRAEALRAQLAREVSALDAAVEELLAASRLELGAAEPRPLDLLALAAEEGARAGVEVEGAPVEIAGDARSLRHLLRNLLENARRHAPGAVELAVGPLAGGGARITVADRGPGVAEAERERIFEPFAKGAGGGEAGLGLGLALVRQIARHHGGDARVRPREGGGSVLEVILRDGKGTSPS
jgi:signal transduction histidine kinase